jgi:hypothetical protein
MGFLIRGRARERLREATTPVQDLNVHDEGDRVTVAMRGHRITLTTDGSPKPVSGEHGAGTIYARRQDGQLVVTARGESGARTTVYRLSDDGRRLILDVRMAGETLPEPLRYQVTYIRR